MHEMTSYLPSLFNKMLPSCRSFICSKKTNRHQQGQQQQQQQQQQPRTCSRKHIMLYAAILPTKFCWATLNVALHVSESPCRSRQCDANTEVFVNDAIVLELLMSQSPTQPCSCFLNPEPHDWQCSTCQLGQKP